MKKLLKAILDFYGFGSKSPLDKAIDELKRSGRYDPDCDYHF